MYAIRSYYAEVSLGGLWAQAIDDGIAEIWVAGHLIEKENS